MRSPWSRLALALAASALLGATCHGGASSTSTPNSTSTHPLPSDRPELAELTAMASAAVRDAAAMMPCSCGCGHMVADCLALHPDCRHAPRMLRLAAALARAGASATEVVQEEQNHYAALASKPLPIELADVPCRGPEGAPVTMVLFSDFECPACATARPLLEALASDGGPARLCFKYFPLDSHAHSRQSAQAAEFARLQGRFWELHDRLFDHQEELDLDGLTRLAADAGLDAAALRQAVESNRFLARVNGSKAEGKAIGVSGTPTLFINGHPFTLPLDSAFLTAAIEDHSEQPSTGSTRD
jgi:protein-disulfide isomerase